MQFQQYQNPVSPYAGNPYMQNPQLANRYSNPYGAQQGNGIIWVQGIEGAKAYQLAPNSIALLMDSDTEGKFYIKTSDNVGMCSLRIFEYVEVTNAPPADTNSVDLSNYVTKDELNEVVSSLKGESKSGK